MKNIKYLGLILLILFTFIYTEKVISVINDNDDIMLEIKEYANNHIILPIEGTINDDTIIPGIKGREVDINGSYNNMKHKKIFDVQLLKYNDIYPEHSIKDNIDKFVIAGNNNKKMVSIIYILNSNYNFFINNDIPINIFINYSYLDSNINNLVNFKNSEIYNYGNNGTYTSENIIMGNNIINYKTNNKSIFCLSKDKNINTLNICSSNKMWTIIPSIAGGYIDIKENVKSGSIILLENVSELSIINSYLMGKGYNIVGLSYLLSENID